VWWEWYWLLTLGSIVAHLPMPTTVQIFTSCNIACVHHWPEAAILSGWARINGHRMHWTLELPSSIIGVPALVMKVNKKVKAKKALKAKQAKVKAKAKAVPLKKKPAKAQDEPSVVDEEHLWGAL
jgi:hypothetical protein